MTKNIDLEARCQYALYKILGLERAAEADNAKRLAKECGRQSHPNREASLLLVDEPELLEAFLAGFAEREEALRPRTDEELAAAIKELEEAAFRGCGQFYELFEQNLTRSVNRWLSTLPEQNREKALELLQATCYNPDEKGVWVYDQEENDITYYGGDEE